MTNDEILDAAARIGKGMLESGAEIYRVEDSLSRVINAYSLGVGEVFAIPNYLHINLRSGDGVSHTRMCRASTMKGVDMRKLNALNELCRKICEQKPTAKEIETAIVEIESVPQYSFLMQIAAGALGSGAFSLFFGGNFRDALCSALCGFILCMVTYYMSRQESNLFFKSIVGSALVALLAMLEMKLGLGSNLDKIIIGALMCLVPGIMITNFMRDIIAGDWVAGLTKLAEALLIAAGIALGSGVALYLVHVL